MLGLSIVPCKSMDSAFYQNQSELSISVLSELLKMFSDIDGLFDEVVEIFGDFRGKSVLFEDSEDFVTSDSLDLRNSIVVSQEYTDLGRGGALLG